MNNINNSWKYLKNDHPKKVIKQVWEAAYKKYNTRRMDKIPENVTHQIEEVLKGYCWPRGYPYGDKLKYESWCRDNNIVPGEKLVKE